MREAQAELDEAGRVLGELVELLVVERGDLLPARHQHREALEVAERLLVGDVELHRARVGLERGAVVLEHLLLEARDAVEQLDLLVRIVGGLDLHLEDADELVPLAGGVVDGLEDERRAERILGARLDALEGLERGLVVGHLLEQIAVELDGARGVVEVLLVELGDPVLVADALGRVGGELGLVLEHAEELGPVLRRLVEDVEPAERLQVVGIELEDALVGVDRARDVAELALVDRADLVVDELLLLRTRSPGRPSCRRRRGDRSSARARGRA